MISRLKEVDPIETVGKIRDLLRQLGVLTIEKWNSSGIEGIYSVRIVIAGTDIGTNGKGATEELALASGYGEFMERLQNGLLFSSFRRDWKPTWFNSVEVDAACFKSRSPILDGVLLGMETREKNEAEGLLTCDDVGVNWEAKRSRLRSWGGLLEKIEDSRDSVRAARYLDLSSGEEAYLPVQMLCAYGSHGMAAGNTYREAVVQGLSEIYERYCQKRILDGHVCPPMIPMKVIEGHFQGIAKYAKYVEAHREIKVQLRDCSLGEGFPVYCICIENVNTHCFSVTFGSHPNPEVALERLFTEVFQGRTIADIGNRICQTPKPEPYNTKGLFKNSLGHYPIEFWLDSPSYGVDYGLLEQRFDDNRSAYNYCMSLCKKHGMRVFARDAGYMGFPAVQIICPGFSEVLCWNDFVLRHAATAKEVMCLIERYNGISEKEKRLVLEFVDYDRKVGLASTARPYSCLRASLAGSELNPYQVVCLFLGLVALDLKEYDRASQFFAKIDGEGMIGGVFQAVADWCKLLKSGLSEGDVVCVLVKFYESSLLDQAKDIVGMSPDAVVDTGVQREIERGLTSVVDRLCSRGKNFQTMGLESLRC